jgi:hypothetical protein
MEPSAELAVPELSGETLGCISCWVPFGAVMLATREGDSEPRLYAAVDVLPIPLEKCFDHVNYIPVKGVEARLVTFDDIAVRLAPSVAGQPHQVLAVLRQDVPAGDSGDWLFGATLANTGLTLFILQAFWAIHLGDRRYAEMRDAYKLGGGDTPARHRQYTYLQALQRIHHHEQSHRLALHAYVASRLSAA